MSTRPYIRAVSEEHAEVKRLVYSADSAKFDSPDYDKIMIDAVTGFITHDEEEENEQFDTLKAILSSEENDVSDERTVSC